MHRVDIELDGTRLHTVCLPIKNRAVYYARAFSRVQAFARRREREKGVCVCVCVCVHAM